MIQCASAEDAKIEAVRLVDRKTPREGAMPEAALPWKLSELEVLVRPFCR